MNVKGSIDAAYLYSFIIRKLGIVLDLLVQDVHRFLFFGPRAGRLVAHEVTRRVALEKTGPMLIVHPNEHCGWVAITQTFSLTLRAFSQSTLLKTN